MSEPKRYIPYIAFENMAYPFPAMREVDANWKQYADVKMAYVTDSDYARLKAEVDSLMTNPTSRLLRAEREENARLKAEVERLTKAGDAMWNALLCSGCSECMGMYDCHDEAMKLWKEAKGVQS